MRQPTALTLLFVSAALASAPAWADVAAGIAAYDDGDFTAAIDLLQPDAEAGDPRAQFTLGQIFADGPEASKDPHAAVRWFEQAAEAGHAEAQFQLGMRYSVGLGTDKDLIAAYKWLRLSERGLGTAAPSTFLQIFTGEMSPDDIAAAEAAITAWQPSATTLAALPVPELEPDPPLPTIDAIDDLTAAYGCADIDAQAASDGAMRVTGVVRDDNDIAALRADLDTAFGGGAVQTDLLPLGDPNCAVAAFIGTHRPVLAVLATSQAVFEEGDLIVVDITADRPVRHLYVDYFQIDGTVIHLIPEAVDGPGHIDPGATLRLGDGSTGDFIWRAAAPFGRELLAVFMSDQPLFDQPRPVDEPTNAYLKRLREAANGQGGAIVADYLTITTAPDRP